MQHTRSDRESLLHEPNACVIGSRSSAATMSRTRDTT
jgi:hypothetical protein